MAIAVYLQDMERKNVPRGFRVLRSEDKPSGVEFSVIRGVNDRTRQNNVYTVHLTPATGLGQWSFGDVSGTIEHVESSAVPSGRLIQGVWVESGERLLLKVEISND